MNKIKKSIEKIEYVKSAWGKVPLQEIADKFGISLIQLHKTVWYWRHVKKLDLPADAYEKQRKGPKPGRTKTEVKRVALGVENDNGSKYKFDPSGDLDADRLRVYRISNKTWRPKGWENGSMEREIGADAILEAIRKEWSSFFISQPGQKAVSTIAHMFLKKLNNEILKV